MSPILTAQFRKLPPPLTDAVPGLVQRAPHDARRPPSRTAQATPERKEPVGTRTDAARRYHSDPPPVLHRRGAGCAASGARPTIKCEGLTAFCRSAAPEPAPEPHRSPPRLVLRRSFSVRCWTVQTVCRGRLPTVPTSPRCWRPRRRPPAPAFVVSTSPSSPRSCPL